MISSIKNFNNKYNINFSAKNDIENKKTNPDTKTNRKILIATMAGLAAVGVALTLICANKKVPKAPSNEILNKVSATFKDGFAYNEKGKLFSGELIKTNPSGEKFNIEIKDGIIQQSTKSMPDGTISWVKKYSKNEYGHKITDIFVPKEDGEMRLFKRILSSKDKIAVFKDENTVEQYWYNTPLGFKRIDEFIDKSDIKNYMQPKNYYSYNGIQVNAFLRDGEFRHPDVRADRIHYEVLNDPECPEYIKEDVRKIMEDNRFILSVIDDLDILTRSSVTKEPMTVYRNAPKWWVDKAKDGILLEDAFCSTSVKKGASMEGLYIGKDAKDGITYTIHLPKGTPFYDLTETNEQEMLLPRKGRFRVVNNTELEYLV